MINDQILIQTLIVLWEVIQGKSNSLNICSLAKALVELHSLPDICRFDNTGQPTTVCDEWEVCGSGTC